MTNLTLDEKKALIRMALEAREQAYVPYSDFMVGAALRAEDGRIFTGCNVENAAYGSTLSAERTALVKAVSEGCRSFTRLAVVGNSADYSWPCGACRQMLNEFAPGQDVDTIQVKFFNNFDELDDKSFRLFLKIDNCENVKQGDRDYQIAKFYLSDKLEIPIW